MSAEQTYRRGDVEAAEVGCCSVVDFTLGVESTVLVVCGAAPEAAAIGQAIHVRPVTAVLWVSGHTEGRVTDVFQDGQYGT